jgi:hypothetical protein
VDSDEESLSDWETDPGNNASTSATPPDNLNFTVYEDLSSPSLPGAAGQNHQPYIEEIVDEGDGPGSWNQGVDESRFIESYPKPAGVPINNSPRPTKFEAILEAEGDRPWGAFETESEWQLAKWLLQNAGHNQITKFLDLPIVRLPFSLK